MVDVSILNSQFFDKLLRMWHKGEKIVIKRIGYKIKYCEIVTDIFKKC